VIEKIQPKPKFFKTIEADYSAVNFVDDGASYFMAGCWNSFYSKRGYEKTTLSNNLRKKVPERMISDKCYAAEFNWSRYKLNIYLLQKELLDKAVGQLSYKFNITDKGEAKVYLGMNISKSRSDRY